LGRLVPLNCGGLLTELRHDSFNQHVLYDTTPLPDSIPKVKEIGASSAPLLSASFFIGARCKDYNDDYMQCKTENPGRGEFECLKEGRRVTRCARSVYVASSTTPAY
jgi:NADH dehydrogenase (ubiquinone) 1 alpha subcomplex subunit 8